MYCWIHRYTSEIVRSNTDHYFGFNYPEWEKLNGNVGLCIALIFRCEYFHDWIKQFPINNNMPVVLRAHPTVRGGSGWGQIRDSKGGDWSEWPAQLRVREFPRV